MAHTYGVNTTAKTIVEDLADIINRKVILVTGVTSGSLGAIFVENVAKGQPRLLILAGRSVEKTQKEADTISSTNPSVKVRVLQLELGFLKAVREAAAIVNTWVDVPHIDVVVNNAGVMAIPFRKTPDDFEGQFGTNHLGPFLFNNLIMSKIMASESPRIVNITSDGHRLNPIRWHDYNFSDGETYNMWHAYGQSKTANMLMAISLAEKLGPKGLLAYSVHPGIIQGTNVGRHLDWSIDYPSLQAIDRALGNAEGWLASFTYKSQQQGAATYVYAAFDPSLKEHNGAYLLNSAVGDPWKDTIKPWATSTVEAERLWRLSENLVGQEFTY